MVEIDDNMARYLLGTLADDILGPPMPNLVEPNPSPMTSADGGTLADEVRGGSFGSFHNEHPFQELSQQLNNHRLMEQYPLSTHSSGTNIDDHALEVPKTSEENSVDAYFKTLVSKSRLQETMTDPLMSKEFQDLVGRCSSILRDEIVFFLHFGNVPILQVCLDPNGMRSMLKLFEHLGEFDQRRSVVAALSHFVVPLFKDYHGQKVIEFCLRNFSDVENMQIFLDSKEHLLEIATNLRGCYMLMNSLEISKGLCRYILFPKVMEICSELAVHPAGNHLVQKLFDFDLPYLTADILGRLQGSYHSLSMDMYGCNVMKTCLLRSNTIWFKEIAWELMCDQDFTELLTDPYGNYVVQAMLSRAKDCGSVIWDILRSMMDAEREALQSSPYGRKLLKLIRRPNNRDGYFRCRS